MLWEWLLAGVLAVELLLLMWATRHHTFLPNPYREGPSMTRPGIPRRDDTFDASAYGTLRYDFKKWGGVQGIIPDPSDEQIEAFLRRLRDIAREFGDDTADDVDIEDASAEQLTAMLEDDTGLRLADAQKAIAEAVSELCQGSPDVAQLLQLPFRVRQGFLGWLQRKLMNPEASAVDSAGAPARRTGG